MGTKLFSASRKELLSKFNVDFRKSLVFSIPVLVNCQSLSILSELKERMIFLVKLCFKELAAKHLTKKLLSKKESQENNDYGRCKCLF